MGLFRHAAASTLAMLILWGYLHDMDSPDGNGIPVLIRRAYGHFKLWAATFKKTPALRSFSKSLMSWPDLATSPWFNTKGSDCMLLVRWLDTYVGQILIQPQKPEHVQVLKIMRAMLQAADSAFSLMTTHRLLLPRRCAVHLYEKMTGILNGYNWLANYCLNNGVTAYAMVYKVHAWKHEAYELFQALKDPRASHFFNPFIHSCEINEDCVGRVSRLSRRVDSRVMERRCLELFYVKCLFLHKRAFPMRSA